MRRESESLLEEELMGFDQVRRGSTESKDSLFAGAARRVINDNMKRRGDKELLKLKEVLEEFEMISEKRMSEGLSQLNFTLGVFNCFFVVIYLVSGSSCCPSISCLVLPYYR